MKTNKPETVQPVAPTKRPVSNIINELPEVTLCNIGNTLALIRCVVQNDVYSPDSLCDKAWHGLINLMEATEAAVEYEYERSLNHWAELDEVKKEGSSNEK